MTLRQYIIFMLLGAAICWIAWGFVLVNMNPREGGPLALIFFYSSFFFAMVGTFSVFGFLIRRAIIKNDEIIFRHVRRTFRQSIIISLFIILSLILLSQQLLTWWNGLLLIILFVVIEGILFTNRKYRNLDYVK